MTRQPSRTSPDRYRWSSNHAVDDADSASRPKLLLVCDYRPREASTVIDHIGAIRRWSRNDVFVLPAHGELPDELDLEAFDGLVIHYNVVMSVDNYLSPLARWRIARFSGTKGAFIQDEHRFVNRTIGVLRTLGINVLFTCVPEGQVPLVYAREALPDMRRTVSVLTGYVAPELLTLPIVPYEARPVDVGYRARRLPPWLGRLGMEKAAIADRFTADAPTYGLRTDISTAEEDRLYGRAWLDFVSHSKAILGAESGASVFDLDGSIEERCLAYLAAHPGATFEELHRNVLAGVDGRIRMNQISPRCFEAAALGTLMVLYPGHYSGVLEPWRHYVPLEKDHRNMGEVVAAIRDPVAWQRITAQARSEVAENPGYSFKAMVETMDDGLDLEQTGRPIITAAAFERIASRSLASLPSSQMHAWGLPPALNRLRHAPRRAARLVAPSPTAIVAAPVGAENRRRMRRRIRVARARAYWALRPRALPRSLRRAHRRLLLEELSELVSIQNHGRRAIASGSASPFVIVVDGRSGEVRISFVSPETGAVGPGQLPSDLASVTALVLDLADPWLVPAHVGSERNRRFAALSAVLQADPAVARHLLAGETPWSAVVLVNWPPTPPGHPAGVDAA